MHIMNALVYPCAEGRNPAIEKLEELGRAAGEGSARAKRRVQTAPARERRRNWNQGSVDIVTTHGVERVRPPGKP